MNYIAETPFMKLYEELSAFNEEPALTEPTNANYKSIDELDSILSAQWDRLKMACDEYNTACGINNYVTAAAVLLCLPNQSNGVNLARCYKGNCSRPADMITWRYLASGGSTSENKTVPDYLDISQSWLYFYISGRILSDKNETEAENCRQEVLSSLNVSEAKFVIASEGLKNIVTGSSGYSAKRLVVGVPFGTSAGGSIPKAFCKSFTTTSDTRRSVTSEDLNKFIQNYLEKYPDGLVPKENSNIQIKDFADFFMKHAFHTFSLSSFYENHPDYADVIAYILYYFYNKTKISRAPRSLQYLVNAQKQEELLLDRSDKPEALVRNLTATNAAAFLPADNADNSYTYLVPSEVVADPDFKFKDDSVDAKIYKNFANWEAHKNDPNVKKAKYIICYCFKSDIGWYLFEQQDSTWITRAAPWLQKVKTDNELVQFINKLNFKQVAVPMVSLSYKSPFSIKFNAA
jgi:hypothetical protein